jgi:hypothetical protein
VVIGVFYPRDFNTVERTLVKPVANHLASIAEDYHELVYPRVLGSEQDMLEQRHATQSHKRLRNTAILRYESPAIAGSKN